MRSALLCSSSAASMRCFGEWKLYLSTAAAHDARLFCSFLKSLADGYEQGNSGKLSGTGGGSRTAF